MKPTLSELIHEAHSDLDAQVNEALFLYHVELTTASIAYKSLALQRLGVSSRQKRATSGQFREAKHHYRSLERGFSKLWVARELVSLVALPPILRRGSPLCDEMDLLVEPTPSTQEPQPSEQ